MKNIKRSLQNLKTDLAQKETILKTLQNHYTHLQHLLEEEILAYFQVTTIEELEEHIQNSIKHFSNNDDRNDESGHCSCKDSEGVLKELYETQEVAQQEADQSMLLQKLNLKVYPCPYGYGWHLTKG